MRSIRLESRIPLPIGKIPRRIARDGRILQGIEEKNSALHSFPITRR